MVGQMTIKVYGVFLPALKGKPIQFSRVQTEARVHLIATFSPTELKLALHVRLRT